MADDVMDADGYENSYTPETFYVANHQTDATNVPSGAWFAQQPAYAHALFSLERRMRAHFGSNPETQLVIGALINGLALRQVRYLTLTEDFLLRCDFYGDARRTSDPERDSDSDSNSNEEEDAGEDGDAYRAKRVSEAEGRAVGPLISAQILKPRGKRINQDYASEGTAVSYFIPPFEQLIDRIAKMDVEEQYGFNTRNKRLRVLL